MHSTFLATAAQLSGYDCVSVAVIVSAEYEADRRAWFAVPPATPRRPRR
jgi:hypothetical protein